MYKHKRAFVAVVSLLLCTLTLLSAFAASWKGYDTTHAVPGKIAPVTPGGGTGNPNTTYNSNCVVAGYRFTCWRSTDANLTEHYEYGTQLGHSINILVNVTHRGDYANSAGQTGKTAPRVFIEGVRQNELLNKITTAQTEIEDDAKYPNETKISSATRFAYATLHYQKANGTHYSMNGGSTFTFTHRLHQTLICGADDKYDDIKTGLKEIPNNPIGGLTQTLAKPGFNSTSSVTIHSGYYMKDDKASDYLNKNATGAGAKGTQSGESRNIYTYIYGFRHSNNLGTDHAGSRQVADGYYAICDVDNASSSVLPFNENPWNVIGDPENNWTRNNVALIATLCGLTPVYGRAPENDSEFAVYDYVIVEPLYSVYWYYQRYYVTASDIGLLACQSALGAYDKSDNWTYPQNGDSAGKYTWFANSSKFPGIYSSDLTVDEYFFGIDGVLNAQFGSVFNTENTPHKFAPKGKDKFGGNLCQCLQHNDGKKRSYHVQTAAMNKAIDDFNAKNGLKTADTWMYKSNKIPGKYINARTGAVVMSDPNGYSYCVGKGSWWYGNTGSRNPFVAPMVVVESMMGVGVFTASNDLPDEKYRIVYHSNYNNGNPSSINKTDPQPFRETPSEVVLKDYPWTDAPGGKISSAYWTWKAGHLNFQGLADNTYHTFGSGVNEKRFSAGSDTPVIADNPNTSVNEVDAWFEKYHTREENGVLIVDLYAAWSTKAVVPVLDRTITNQSSIKAYASYNMGRNSTTKAALPKTVVFYNQSTGAIVPLVYSNKESAWLPTKAVSGTGYIVYSYHDIEITGDDINTARQSANNNGRVQVYPITWNTSTNVFPMDFYTFQVTAPNATLQYTCELPNRATATSPATVINVANKNSFTRYIPRGTKVEWSATTNAGFTYTSGDIGKLKAYGSGSNPYIGAENNIPISINSDTHAYTETKHAVMRKEIYSITPTAGKLLVVEPTINGFTNYGDPFKALQNNAYIEEDYYYYVSVTNEETQITTYYTTNKMMADILDMTYINTADASITEPVSPTGRYSVSAVRAPIDVKDISDKADVLAAMAHISTINMSSVSAGNPPTATILVPYYTIDVNRQTTALSSHMGGTVVVSIGEPGEEEYTYEYYEYLRDAGGTEYLDCTDSFARQLEVVALKGSSYKIEVPFYSTWEEDLRFMGGSEYHGTSLTAAQDLSIEYHPYTYIGLTLDGNPLNVEEWKWHAEDDDIITMGDRTYRRIPTPDATHEGSNKAATLPLVIYPDIDTANYNTMEPVQYFWGYYDAFNTIIYNAFTVTVDADNGYAAYQIDDMGTRKAYVIGSVDVTADYSDCISGDTKQVTRTLYTGDKEIAFYGEDTFQGGTVSFTGALRSAQVFDRITAKSMLPDAAPEIRACLGTQNMVDVPADNEEHKLYSINSNNYTSISNVRAPVHVQYYSKQTLHDVKFVFRLNHIAGSTEADPYTDIMMGAKNITLGRYNIKPTFNETTNEMSAIVSIPAGTYTMAMDGTSTKVSYNITGAATYYIDFYTLQLQAGVGIEYVEFQSNEDTFTNGTLPYYENNARRWNTRTVWAESARQFTKPTIIAQPQTGKLFTKWSTISPFDNTKSNVTFTSTSNKYSNTATDTINVGTINMPTILLAGAQRTLPDRDPHETHYGVEVRVFVDGIKVNPWDNLSVLITTIDPTLSTTNPNFSQLKSYEVHDGSAFSGFTDIWLSASDAHRFANTPIQVTIFPSLEFQNQNVPEAYRYTTTTTLIPNQVVTVDIYYSTQSISTTVNGAPALPWANVTGQYTQSYKGKDVTTSFTFPDSFTAKETVMIDGSSISVYGVQDPSKQSPAQYTLIHTKPVTKLPQAHIIPYFTVSVDEVCNRLNTAMSCYKFYLNGMEISGGKSVNVLKNTYNITYTDACTHNNTSGHYHHTLLGLAKQDIKVFKLEYKDSGDGVNPFPTLVYTGETRTSNSALSADAKQVTVADETRLLANLNCSLPGVTPVYYNLTLNAQPTFVCTDHPIMVNATTAPLCSTCGKQMIPLINIITQANNQTSLPAYGSTTKYLSGTSVNITAALSAQAPVYPVYMPVSVTIQLNGSADTREHKVYYSTETSWSAVANIINNTPDSALSQAGVFKLTQNGATYSTQLPPSEKPYYLYVDGVKMSDKAVNTLYQRYTLGNPSYTWNGTSGINGQAVTTTTSPTFSVTMNTNRTYTVYAQLVNDGEQSGQNTTVNLYDAKIYLQSDYQNKVPYSNTDNGVSSSKTIIIVNDNKYLTPLELDSDGRISITIPVQVGKKLTIKAPIHRDYGDTETAYYTVYHTDSWQPSNPRQFTLNYFSLTVTSPDKLHVTLNGADSLQEFFLGSYIVGNGAVTSCNTQATVNADGSYKTTVSLTQKFHDSTVTVTTTPAVNQQLSLIAKNVNYPGYTKLSNVEGSGEYIIYVLPKHHPDVSKLSSTFEVNNMICGLAPASASIDMSIADSVPTLYAISLVEGKKIDVFFNGTDVKIAAAEGTTYTATLTNNKYTFTHVYNGNYGVSLDNIQNIQINGNSCSGAVQKASDLTTITVNNTKSVTIAGNTTYSFHHWDTTYTTGSVNATHTGMNAYAPQTGTSSTASATVIMDGTRVYVARAQAGGSASTVVNNTTGSFSITLNPVRVEVYVDGVLANPFVGQKLPVYINGSAVNETSTGKSNVLYLGTNYTIGMQSNVHANGADLTYNAANKTVTDAAGNTYSGALTVTTESGTTVIKAYYYTVHFKVNPESYGTINAQCSTSEGASSVIVASGTPVNGAATTPTLLVGQHNKYASANNIPGKEITFTNWNRNSGAFSASAITSTTTFTANFTSNTLKYTVTLHNRGVSRAVHALNITNNSLVSKTIYSIPQITIKSPLSGTTQADAPDSFSTSNSFEFGTVGTLGASTNTAVITGQSSTTTTFRLNLTGPNVSGNHTIVFTNKSTGTKSTFQSNGASTVNCTVTTGTYSITIDGVPVNKTFSYTTHGTQLLSSNGTYAYPKYTGTTAGVVYAPYQYSIESYVVDRWTKIESTCPSCHANGKYVENGNNYTCAACGTALAEVNFGGSVNSINTATVTEDQIYNVYSRTQTSTATPLIISLDVELAYAINVQTVLNGTLSKPFDKQIVVSLVYDVNGSETQLNQTVDANGHATFHIPVGATYTFIGANASEKSATQVVTGFSSSYGSYNAFTGGTQANHGQTHYVLYYTSTVKAGKNIISPANAYAVGGYNSGSPEASVTSQYGQQVHHTVSGTYSTVQVTVLKDNAAYTGRTVTLRDSNGNVKYTGTASGGVYTFTNVVAGTYYVYVDGVNTKITTTVAPSVAWTCTTAATCGKCPITNGTTTHPTFTVTGRTICEASTNSTFTATVKYYTLTLSGDDGIASTVGAGVYLEGTKPNIDAALKSTQKNIGKTTLSVTLLVDGKPYSGLNVTIGGQKATEVGNTGVYTTTATFGSGTYNVVVSSSNTTYPLLDNGTVMGSITLTSDRNYTWSKWVEGHTSCAYGTCTNRLGAAATVKANSVTMSNTTSLRATTTYTDTFYTSGDTTINFYGLRLDGDAGIKSVTINGVTYTPATTITAHGSTSTTWTSTNGATVAIKQVIVRSGRTTSINAAIKNSASNHAEAKTPLSVTIRLDGIAYTNLAVQIGGYDAIHQGNGVYTTTHTFSAGTYDVTVKGFNATTGIYNASGTAYGKIGSMTLTSTREYRWYTWAESTDNCLMHSATHSSNCTGFLSSAATNASNSVANQDEFVHLLAKTQFKDTFSGTSKTFDFYVLRLDADAGIKSVVIGGTTYTPSPAITSHGSTSTTWTSTNGTTTFGGEIIVLKGTTTSINATVKDKVTSHSEAKTTISLTIKLDNAGYAGRTVTIGGYTATHQGNGVYTTSQKFAAGTYAVVVDGRSFGTVTVGTVREYRWYTWSEPWNADAHQCKTHGSTHTCGDCDGKLTAAATTQSNSVSMSNSFAHLVARTQYKDTFTFTWSHTQAPGGVINYRTLTVTEKLNSDVIDTLPFTVSITDGNNKSYSLHVYPKYESGCTVYSDQEARYTVTSTDKVLDISTAGGIVPVTYNSNKTITIPLVEGDKYTVTAAPEHEDRNQDNLINQSDFYTDDMHAYERTTIANGTVGTSNVNVTIQYWTVTVVVKSNNVNGLPGFGSKINGATNAFEAPVWLDDVVDTNEHEGYKDGYGNTALKPVDRHTTVKAYLNNQEHQVSAKNADDNATTTTNAKYLETISSGKVTAPISLTVNYYSVHTDHFGGFTSVTIKSNDSAGYSITANTTSGATGNAKAEAFFRAGESVTITTTLASHNTFKGWDKTTTPNTGSTWDGVVEHTTTSVTISNVSAQQAYSAHANTTYRTHYFVTMKNNMFEKYYQDTYVGNFTNNTKHVSGKNHIWYANPINAGKTDDGVAQSWQTIETAQFTAEINNRNWTTITVSNPGSDKYSHYEGYIRTLHSITSTANGMANTTIKVVVDANQVGDQSYVDFYFTRDGSNPGGPKQENVKITYVMNGGTYNGSSNNYSETHTKGTDITLINPKAPTGKVFVGWFLKDADGNEQYVGMIGEALDHYLLTKDTIVYAAYVTATDLGITANNIYGTIKPGMPFSTSATVINRGTVSIVTSDNVYARLTIKDTNGNVVHTQDVRVIIPGAPAAGEKALQLVWANVPALNLSASKQYVITWSLVYGADHVYNDTNLNNNSSSLNAFTPGTSSMNNPVTRPGYQTNPDADYKKDTAPDANFNVTYHWEYWEYVNNNFVHRSSDDMLDITLLLKPENENGLRTYTTDNKFGFHDYTTRSGYGLSLHSFYNSNCTHTDTHAHAHKDYMYSQLKYNSTWGTLDAYMVFPEYNYQSMKSNKVLYHKITIDSNGALRFTPYDDYQSDDINDKYAHYTPMWLPDGEYKPVTHISGMWTPLGELSATVQHGTINDTLKIRTNHIWIKGSMYDDLYGNP